jgi:hypothetical protein
MEDTNNTNTIVDLGYGFKKDGTPKQRPGKKASNETMRSFYVIDGVPIAGRGRPSPEQYAKRQLVTMPKHETYDSNIHGFGIRQEEDDLMVRIIEGRKAKVVSKRVAKVVASNPAPEPAQDGAHNTEITLDNSAVNTNLSLGEVVTEETVAV